MKNQDINLKPRSKKYIKKNIKKIEFIKKITKFNLQKIYNY